MDDRILYLLGAVVLAVLLMISWGSDAHDCSERPGDCLAEFNGNGEIDAGDLLIAQRHLLGLIPTSPQPPIPDFQNNNLYWYVMPGCDTWSWEIEGNTAPGVWVFEDGEYDLTPVQANCNEISCWRPYTLPTSAFGYAARVACNGDNWSVQTFWSQ